MKQVRLRAGRMAVCLVATLVMVLTFWLPRPAAAVMETAYGTHVRFYAETGHNVSGLFLTYYDQMGGLFVNGLPLTDEFTVQGMTVQVFERTIFERHVAADGTVYVARRLVGHDITKDRDTTSGPFAPITSTAPDTAVSRFFAQTGHSLSNGFLNYWNTYGGLPVFGYPLSQEFSEQNPADGQTYVVQYFERARFEYHPANLPPYDVELGLLGQQVAQSLYGPETFAPTGNAAPGPQAAVIVPSLMYHHINYLGDDAFLNRFTTPPYLLVQELDWLQANGYHTVTTAQIADYLLYGIALPPKPVNLRFDDGWSNQLFAATEMKKRGMTASFFIPSKLMYGGIHMSPAQVEQLDADGFEVAAHTRTHDNLVTGAGNPVWEVGGSKVDLDALLGHPVRSFAYPYGAVNAYAETLVRQSGFALGIGIAHGYVWRRSTMFDQPAITMENGWTLDHFVALLRATPTTISAAVAPDPNYSPDRVSAPIP